MRNKMISISEVNFDLLKEEQNASELINRLLNEYFISLEKKKEPEILDPITLMEKEALRLKYEEENKEIAAIIQKNQDEEIINKIFK